MNSYVVFIADHRWRLGIVVANSTRIISLPEGADASLSDRIAVLQKELVAAGHTREPLLLSIPSSWFLQANISTDHLETGDRRKTLAYRLEEHLPLSAEDFVADYRQRDDGTAWSVCVETSRLRPIVDALIAAGMSVRHICPLGLLAAATVAQRHLDARGILIKHADASAEFVELQDALPVSSAWYADFSPALSHHLTNWQTAAHAPCLYIIAETPISPEFTPRLAPQILPGFSPDQAALQEAARVLRGDAWPWIDFRRDALAAPNSLERYRSPLIAAAFAVILLLVCVIVATQIRGRSYAAVAQRAQQTQITTFKQLFPDQRAPSAIRARLSAEQRRLAALQGRPGDIDSRDQLTAPSSLLRWRDFLKALPPDQRFQLFDIDFQRDLCRIEGQAPSHVDADRLVSALRQTGLFDIDAPKTETLKEGGVNFSFVARPRNTAVARGVAP